MAKKSGNLLGSWSFLIGVILALIVGIFGSPNSIVISYVLVILGVLIGLLNIADEEVHPFLISGTVLVLVSALGQSILSPISHVNAMLSSLVALFVPATIIVALKHVFSLARR